jgi:hypothetical protein
VRHNSFSDESYASASKTHADDETFDSGSKNTSVSSNPPKTQQKSQPPKRGIPAPMASSIPTGSKGPSLPEKTALCVKAISYVGNIKHARAETDHTDICFITVGRAFISALELVDSSKSFSLLSAYELKPGDRANTKPDNIKIQGQLVVKFEPEYNNPDGNVKTLRRLIQQVIYGEYIKQVVGFPSWIKAFAFEVNSVNHPEHTVCGLFLGINAAWFDRRDSIGLTHFPQMMVDLSPLGVESDLPDCLATPLDIQRNIGVMIYQSSKVKMNGLMGKALGLAYAKTEEGENAARYLLAAFANGRVVEGYGGLRISGKR